MKILYVDMDGVLVNFESGIRKLSNEQRKFYHGHFYKVSGIFGLMDPMPGAIESFKKLATKYDTYVLSSPPWDNPTAWTDKLLWVRKHLGETCHKRLILSHNKNLNIGDYLIDDNLRNGVESFKGEHIHFGSEKYPDWNAVCKYML